MLEIVELDLDVFLVLLALFGIALQLDGLCRATIQIVVCVAFAVTIAFLLGIFLRLADLRWLVGARHE